MSERLSEEAKKLRELTGLKPGDTIYTTVVHVSRSGMYRCIKMCIVKNGELHEITYPLLANAIEKYDKNHGCLGISGVGMDMAFEAVYRLGRIMYPNGYTEKNAVLYTEEGQAIRDRDGIKRGPVKKKDGGYAFRKVSF